MNNYFTNQEKIIQKNLIQKGYFVFNIDDKALINNIRKKTMDHVKNWLRSEKIKFSNNINLLDNVHKYIPIEKLNSFRIYVYNKLNIDKKFHKNYFFIGKKYIDILCGNEVSMQKK